MNSWMHDLTHSLNNYLSLECTIKQAHSATLELISDPTIYNSECASRCNIGVEEAPNQWIERWTGIGVGWERLAWCLVWMDALVVRGHGPKRDRRWWVDWRGITTIGGGLIPGASFPLPSNCINESIIYVLTTLSLIVVNVSLVSPTIRSAFSGALSQW